MLTCSVESGQSAGTGRPESIHRRLDVNCVRGDSPISRACMFISFRQTRAMPEATQNAEELRQLCWRGAPPLLKSIANTIDYGHDCALLSVGHTREGLDGELRSLHRDRRVVYRRTVNR